ncbi:MAG: hypothetical protein ABSF83_12415 [Nitrososphaerales archaeon]
MTEADEVVEEAGEEEEEDVGRPEVVDRDVETTRDEVVVPEVSDVDGKDEEAVVAVVVVFVVVEWPDVDAGPEPDWENER